MLFKTFNLVINFQNELHVDYNKVKRVSDEFQDYLGMHGWKLSHGSFLTRTPKKQLLNIFSFREILCIQMFGFSKITVFVIILNVSIFGNNNMSHIYSFISKIKSLFCKTKNKKH